MHCSIPIPPTCQHPIRKAASLISFPGLLRLFCRGGGHFSSGPRGDRNDQKVGPCPNRDYFCALGIFGEGGFGVIRLDKVFLGSIHAIPIGRYDAVVVYSFKINSMFSHEISGLMCPSFITALLFNVNLNIKIYPRNVIPVHWMAEGLE